MTIFFIRAQAAVLNLPHLTNDRRRTKTFPDVDFEFVCIAAAGGFPGGAEIIADEKRILMGSGDGSARC